MLRHLFSFVFNKKRMGKSEQNIFIVLAICALHLQSSEGYSHCWDGDNGGMYFGTKSITTSGKVCQAWAAQSPQSHGYTDDAKFPFDGTVSGANNYCRDPDFNFQPWCYTLDPGKRWEICDVPICINLPCGAGIITGASDPTTLSANIDSNTGMSYLSTDTTYRVSCCGTVSKWKIYIKSAGTVALQIWRHDNATGNYVLKGENLFTYSAAQVDQLHEESIASSARISVEGGDLLGWSVTADMISYDTGGATGNLLLSTSAPSVGQSVDFGAAGVENGRNYAIGIDIAMNFPPYFTNSGNTVSVTDALSVGTPVFLLFVTDNDPNDIDGLSVTMETASTYFELDPTTLEVKVKATLAAGIYALDFEVKDHCDETGKFTVTATVTKAPVVISNLPDFGNVSESAVIETLAFTLEFSSTGPHTCTIDSYAPTRAEGNPFLIKPTPSSDIGVYIKAAAAVKYSITTKYDLTLTCGDGSTSDTKLLTVNILPNGQPTFIGWSGAVSISAPATPNGKIIYTANVTDAESDPITMEIASCAPLPCPFTINNDFELSTTEDFLLHKVSSYAITLSAKDAFNTVTSSVLTVTVNDINVKPIFTNLPATPPVSEDKAIGTEVFKVSQYDANIGDTPTFSATYAPAVCSSLFSLAAADGRITTLASMDFETVAATSCVLTVTVNDGKEASDPDTVTLSITDLDEPPVFSSSLYQISTPEVPGATVLPDPGITVTDAEGTAVTLSLNCGGDSGYLSIDSGTRLITMVTAYELDPSMASYKITCKMPAVDGTSHSSTASLEVEITDANDNTPTFTSAMYTINILNTQALGVIGSAPATDADSTSPNNHITYSLSGSPEFTIDASGNIILTGDVTGVTGLVAYNLTATATDGGTPSLASTAIVQVLVSDTATTTTTTTTTTTASTGVVGSTGTGFFSSTLNIIWFAIAIALGTFVLAVAGYFLYRLCTSKAAGAKMTSYKQPPNNFEKERPTKQVNENPVRKRSLNDTSKSKEPDRPISNDSGINVSLRTPPSNTRFQPISVQPTDNVFNADETPNTNHLNMQDIRKWRLEQGQWRQAMLAGRLKQ